MTYTNSNLIYISESIQWRINRFLKRTLNECECKSLWCYQLLFCMRLVKFMYFYLYNSRGRRFSSRGHLRDIFPNHCADHSIFEYREINIISRDLLRTVLFELAFSYVISVTDYYKHLLFFCLIPIKTVRFIFVVVRGLIICVVVHVRFCNLKFVYIFLNNFYSKWKSWIIGYRNFFIQLL